MIRSESWFRRQDMHALRCIAEADRAHTPEELASAEAALAIAPNHPQQPLRLQPAFDAKRAA